MQDDRDLAATIAATLVLIVGKAVDDLRSSAAIRG